MKTYLGVVIGLLAIVATANAALQDGEPYSYDNTKCRVVPAGQDAPDLAQPCQVVINGVIVTWQCPRWIVNTATDSELCGQGPLECLAVGVNMKMSNVTSVRCGPNVNVCVAGPVQIRMYPWDDCAN